MIKYLTLSCAILSVTLAQMAPPKYEEEKTTEKYKENTEPLPPPPPEYREPSKPSYNPGNSFNSDCKYDDVPFTDCDPFHLVRWRQMKLIFGGSHCESYKNETERCSHDDFPPGTT